MKTFKMLSLAVVDGEQLINYPLHDGLIINQENSQRSWVLELLVDEKHEGVFLLPIL